MNRDKLKVALNKTPGNLAHRALLGSRKDDPESVKPTDDPTTYFVRLWNQFKQEWQIILVRHRGYIDPDVNTAVNIQLDQNGTWFIVSLSSQRYDEQRDNH